MSPKPPNYIEMTDDDLEAEVRRHNKLYFEDRAPEISDYEFDAMVEELRRRAPDSPVLVELISDASRDGVKVTHLTPMLSLDKCYDEAGVEDWAGKFEGLVIASPKIDGCAVSIVYGSEGTLERAATRGDGIVGEDITKNALMIKTIPHAVKRASIEVRGEVYMPLSTFERYRSEFSNPRNLAAGAIKQKDPQRTRDYGLSFFAYDIISSEGEIFESEQAKRDELVRLGFEIVESRRIEKGEMEGSYRDFLKRRAEFDFETDGVVFRVDSCAEQRRLGKTIHHPRFAIAYKFQGDSGETTLIDVEWSVSRTGAITPVAIVEPVELSGAMVRRASLHNAGFVKRFKLSRGARVVMMRRGGVIPNLEQVVADGAEEIMLPSHCPSCGAAIREEDDFLYCTNAASCVKSAVGELSHFVKELGIDGFGEKLLARLYESGRVVDPSELFELSAADLLEMERMGETLAAKLIVNIDQRRKVSLDIFLRSLGIRELGKHASRILTQFGDLAHIRAAKEEELADIHSFGSVIAREIVDGLKRKSELIDRLLKHIEISEVSISNGGVLSGKSFLFTGKMISSAREDAQALVQKLGGVAAQSVTKDLDFLVIGDGGGAGSKLAKARKLQENGSSVKVISESEFLEMAGGKVG